MSCFVKMTDCSFDEYIISLCVLLGLVLFGRATVSATCRGTTHTLPPINVCNTHIVHGEVREKESVVDAPESCKKNIYIYIAIYFVPIFIPHQLSVRHNLRVSCNCAACFFKREIQVAPIHVYICAACFFKREIQVALFTFTHLHRHLISSLSPIHLFIFTNIYHLFICMFTFTFKQPTIVLDRLVYVLNHM